MYTKASFLMDHQELFLRGSLDTAGPRVPYEILSKDCTDVLPFEVELSREQLSEDSKAQLEESEIQLE
jgi:hypothetical protein